jgi:hypothetical protein
MGAKKPWDERAAGLGRWRKFRFRSHFPMNGRIVTAVGEVSVPFPPWSEFMCMTPVGNRGLSRSVLRNGPIPPMVHYVFVGLVGGILCVTTAQAQLTCSQAARAYSSGHIAKTSTLGFLKSCVDAELKRLISSGAPLPTKPAAVNRLICVHTSKDFAAKVRPLTATELTYLDACLDRAIGSR